MAQVVLGVAGAAAGFAVGGPQGALIGFSVGMALGAPAMKVPGAKLGEIAKITAREGDPRVIVWGRVRPIGGNLVAVQDPRIVKKKKKSGGKGGGGTTTTTTTIFRTYAVGVCEGPITAFIRIWRNNKQVYDGRPGNAWGAENNPTFLAKAKLYLGKYDQLPDPSLEAVFGVGNVPAMRGTAYILLADEDLTDMGGAVPQWLFEVERSQVVPLIPGVSWSGVASNGTTVVAVGSVHPKQAMTSANGFNWEERTTPVNSQWIAVCATGSVIVAISSNGGAQQAMTSADNGVTWVIRDTPVSAFSTDWIAVAEKSGRFCAIRWSTSTANAMTSDDNGITWTQRFVPEFAGVMNDLFSSPSGFVAVGDFNSLGSVMVSNAGVSWTLQAAANNNRWMSGCFGGGVYVAVSNNDAAGDFHQIMTSADALTWVQRVTPTWSIFPFNWQAIAHNGVAFAAVARDGDVAGKRAMNSTDGGVTWTLRDTPADYAWVDICAHGTLFVAIAEGSVGAGHQVMTSADNGVTWVLGGA